MKQLLSIFCAAIVLLACSKENTPTPPPVIDYSLYKLKTITHSQRNYSGSSSSFSADTADFTYSGTTTNYTRKTSDGFTSIYTLTLENNIYTQVVVNNNIPSSSKTYYRLNAAGLIDSNWIQNNSTVTQGGSYRYHSNGTKDYEVYKYGNYINTRKCYYQDGIFTHSQVERIPLIASITPAKDSVRYEYTALPFRAEFYNTGMPTSLYGKPDKQLPKKATFFNQLDNNAIRQTMEYSYQTNSIGLVTQKIMNIYIQPGNRLMLADTTSYSYYNQ